jgi:hypothetical protein
MIKRYKFFMLLVLLVFLAACGGEGASDGALTVNEQEVAIAIALTQTAAAVPADGSVSEATQLPPPPTSNPVLEPTASPAAIDIVYRVVTVVNPQDGSKTDL